MSYSPPPHFREICSLQPDGSYKVDEAWHSWFLNLATLFSRGPSVTIPLAKVTPGGADGSLTIVNGMITSVTAPT